MNVLVLVVINNCGCLNLLFVFSNLMLHDVIAGESHHSIYIQNKNSYIMFDNHFIRGPTIQYYSDFKDFGSWTQKILNIAIIFCNVF